ncbi:hypothetical protein FAI40_08310 [Acetobacteraceae bacterium]|nr:hypothetical protein FAI40_08310 [Acetobacteraceae bacterium]
MKNVNSSFKNFSLAAALLGLSFLVPHLAKAQGIITLDPTLAQLGNSRVAQGVRELANEAQQLSNMEQQLQNMVTNTLAPAGYIWDNVENVMSEMQSIQNQYQYYKDYGGAQGFVDQFATTGFYAGSPCYQLSLDCDADTLWNAKKKLSDSINKTNQAAILTNAQQVKNLDAQTQTINKLNLQNSGVKGRLQSQEMTNMYLSHIAAQNQQEQQMLLANFTAEANERAKRADEEAQAVASRNALLSLPDSERQAIQSYEGQSLGNPNDPNF